MDEKKKIRKRSLVGDIFFTTMICAFALYVIVSNILAKDTSLLGMLAVWINAGVAVGMVYVLIKRIKHPEPEETWDRYCTQVVNGQMTEFPTILKQQCSKSIAEGARWADGIKASMGAFHSYRIVDLADGSIIVIDGKEVRKAEKRQGYEGVHVPNRNW
jgi:hypothetical protein